MMYWCNSARNATGVSALSRCFSRYRSARLFPTRNCTRQKRTILYKIADELGLSRQQLDHLFHLAGGVASPKTEKAAIKEAYEILGVSKDASDADVKKAYRRLMNQHHPDKLVSKGLPEEMMKLANEKTQQIKEAYEHIKKSRQ